jgi:hypothetical protein
MKYININKNAFKKSYKDAMSKTKKLFDVDEQIRREELKLSKMKKKERLFNLKQQNLKLKTKMQPKKDPLDFRF